METDQVGFDSGAHGPYVQKRHSVSDSPIMPIVAIDAEGTCYAFTDSGPIQGGVYQTLVIFHGTLFNGESFEPLVPLFNRRGVRVLNVSRRSYGVTSAHSAADIGDLAAGRNEFWRVLARDVGNLLVWVLDNLGPFAEQSIDVLGWSMGTSTTLSLFGQKDVVEPEVYERIGVYLRRLIIYDAPLNAYGFDVPQFKGQHDAKPPRNASASDPMSSLDMHFCKYFDHPDLQSRLASGVNFSDDGVRPTLERMSAAELSRFVDLKAMMMGAEAGTASYPRIKQALREQAQVALFDAGMVLPRVEVAVIGCTRSAWAMMWAFIELERKYKEVVAEGGHARVVAFVELAGANHFAHYDAPEEFVECVVDIMYGE